ncbi:glycosyltransferase [Pseudomonas gingeri]|uniref:Uncharacterized protein n=1 Tax=Pseudomonas gingeri TaxID=117681 RepID=A0A7Y7WW33_9PSED|nr:hypothetical protein [Pseudomonas gingeri]NWB87268.1 hypothetical protein [Pseudomonas gingeri]
MNELAVAVAWNQGHYIPWRGFHPLYSGLFDRAPVGVAINAWDNVALQNQLASSADVRRWMLSGLAKQADHQVMPDISGFEAESRQLMRKLPGDIEIFHSVPFPSLARPFLLHFESLRSLFSPWVVAQDTVEEKLPLIREHYRRLLGGPLCLGVFSHQPDALGALSDFLETPEIEPRLFTTPIGLPAPMRQDWKTLPEKPPLSQPRFLFVVTPDHESDFFSCGGHRVLRFWKDFCAAGHRATLSMVCERPTPEALDAAGVDHVFIERETGRSILWAASSSAQVETLMAGSHIFLQPADVLCTFDILRAMSLGCVPVIAAVQGSNGLLQDNVHGVTVGAESVAVQPWKIPARTSREDELIVEELLLRVPELLVSQRYFALQQAAHQRAMTDFTVEAFADTFWTRVLQLYAEHRTPAQPALAPPIALKSCLLDAVGLRRAFGCSARPELWINTGLYSVWSQGAYFVLLEGCPVMVAQDWSVLTQYRQPQGRPIVFAHSLPGLMGRYLPQPGKARQPEPSQTLRIISSLLLPFPRLHSRCSQWLRQYRGWRKALSASAENPAQAAPAAAGGHGAELQLVVEGFHGFNIILYKGCFHAVLQSDGALTAEKLDKGRYKRSYSGGNLQVVKQSVIAGLAGTDSAPQPETTIRKGKA